MLNLTSVCTILLVEFNQFAGEPGTKVHMGFAVVIAVLFMICTFLMGLAFEDINKSWYCTNTGFGIAFPIACSGFLIIPEAYEGAYE